MNAKTRELYDFRGESAAKLADLAAIDLGDERDLTDAELAEHASLLEGLAEIDAKIDRVKATDDLAASAPAALPVAASAVTVGHNYAEDRPWGPELHSDATPAMRKEANAAALGEHAVAVIAATRGQGFDPRLQAAGTGHNTAIPSEGGFAVPEQVAPGIEREMFEGGELLSRVDTRTVSGDSMTYIVQDETSRVNGSRQGGIRGYWVDQGTAPTASETKLARIEMKLRKVGTVGYVTDELVADAAAMGGELNSMYVDEIMFATEAAIFEGDGAGKPQGFTNANCLVSVAKESGQAAATINTTNLSKMWARMPARSKSNAVWLGNVDVEPQLDALSLDSSVGSLQPRFVNYGPSGVLTLKGRPFIPVEYASTLGTVDDLVLADLSKYRLIRKGGVETASSIHVKFIEGEMTLRAFYRVDGQAVPRAAVTPFKGSNTQSPFVTLATRS
jgi:HK97 family phage major capsid protein